MLGVAALSGVIGWGLGRSAGEAERQAIIDSLPETRAAMAALESQWREPMGRELVCEQIFDLVEGELREEHRLGAEDRNVVNERLRRDRD